MPFQTHASRPGDARCLQSTSHCSVSWDTCSKDIISSLQNQGLLRSSHIELSSGTAERRNQRAQVQQHTHPAGGHLHPEDGPAPTEEGFNVGTFIVEPAGDGHHHIKGSQQEYEMEIGIAIDGASLLVINNPRSLFHILLLFSVLSIGTEAKATPSHFLFRSCISSLQSIRTWSCRRCQTWI